MLTVEVISKETIKPSSPTPQNLRYIHLSYFDQLMLPPWHIHVLFYYLHLGTTKKLSHLKKSLSQVLMRFYPLAGRIKKEGDDTHVECNDQGVDFYEARVHGSLDKFLQHPSIEESNRLLPSEIPLDAMLAVQFNVFTCGGSAVGVLLSHVLADAWSLFMFVNSWAANARGDAKKVVSPIFGFASIFPPTHVPKVQQVTTAEEMVVLKRFLFEEPMIAKLREKVSVRAGFFPTRAEALNGLLWRCSMRARWKEGHERKPVAMLAVDIRGRMEPPLLESSFGNLVVRNFVTGDRLINDCGSSDSVGYLERRFRESMGKIKGNGIREVVESDGGMGISEIMRSPHADEWEKLGFDLSTFSSLGRFPVYECDFGWGKPEWISFGNFHAKNAVILMPTKSGKGIEAWVHLVEGDMAKFEQDPEILAYVQPFGITSKY